MTLDSFIAKFKDILETDEDISLDTELAGLEDWDSLTKMATYTWLNSMKIDSTVNELGKMKTVKELAIKAGVQL